ncbi:MAG: HD domain-containing protein [Clostridia bacterium]|nr:HD domain-containing protein [Clostridia bacterium]
MLFALSCLIVLSAIPAFVVTTNAASYMSNKTEIPVNLEVSGAEALCQTEDGYIWIAQYSWLTRYDSEQFVTYKSFEYEGREYSVTNVRALAADGNTLYVATSGAVYVYKDNQFSPLVVDAGVVITDINLDAKNGILYICTLENGGIVYNLSDDSKTTIPGTDGKEVRDIALDTAADTYYYQTDEGVYDKDGKEIIQNPRILEIYSYGADLFMAEDSGIIFRYDMEKGKMLDDITVPDQVNKMLYSEKDALLFVACEKEGIYCVDLSSSSPVITPAGELENKSQLVDLMVDYEGNLWVASHYIGASGVSIITKNALSELLFDDEIWQALSAPPAFDRNVYAVEKHDDILYIVAATRIYRYDLKQNKILPDNVIMQTIDEYAEAKTNEGKEQDDNFSFSYAPKDFEVFKDKIYFAVSNIGLLEYDPASEKVVIYDADYIQSHIEKTVGDPDLSLTNSIRSMRSFDDYLVLGYSKGIMRFDGADFSVMNIGSNVLYINKTKDGKILFDKTKGLFVIDDDFSEATEIPTEEIENANRLKFLVDGDYLFYTLNSRLFRMDTTNEEAGSKEITIPYIKGSIVELAKIKCTGKNGEEEYKYVIGSQTQLYITDSLDVETLTDYDMCDATSGLQPIIANTSGFYDEAEQKYYLQSTNGIFVYDFNLTREVPTPVKIVVSSVELDGVQYYGNDIHVAKDVYRVAFDLSVLGFRPNNGFTIYYKLDGIDEEFIADTNESRSFFYTNLPGGAYDFRVYVKDEYGQDSNVITIHLEKDKKVSEQWWFWAIIAVVAAGVVFLIAALIIRAKTKQSMKRQLEYKNITVESIQAIARTIDAKDEYTNGHSIRVGAYSKVIAENMGMSSDEVDNIYYIALLHDIGKIAIPDSILNKPGRLTDEEFAVMKSHTTRGAAILKGISTIPQIVEGAKSHHEKYDGSGYPEGIKGDEIPFVARIICCADCFDAMASKRVYKEPFSLEVILGEFERCSGTQFDPEISKVVVELIASGKLKPYTAENTYLGSDGKTHRISKKDSQNNEHEEGV